MEVRKSFIAIRSNGEDKDILEQRSHELGFKSSSEFVREAIRFYTPDLSNQSVKEYRG
jgi:Arc/MetJ-type ribon-helix-helix transcriptional regulator